MEKGALAQKEAPSQPTGLERADQRAKKSAGIARPAGYNHQRRTYGAETVSQSMARPLRACSPARRPGQRAVRSARQ